MSDKPLPSTITNLLNPDAAPIMELPMRLPDGSWKPLGDLTYDDLESIVADAERRRRGEVAP